MSDNQEPSETLLKYISVLVDTYPKPITRAELAEKSGVSKAAVTKQNERLYEFSNKNEFAFRGLVLNEKGDVPGKIAWMFITNKRFSRFVKSRYFRAIIQSAQIHEKLTESYPAYGDYFVSSDTAFMIQTVLVKAMVLDHFQHFGQRVTNPDDQAFMWSMSFIRLIPKAMESIDLEVRDKEDLLRWLTLRDKWYFFIEHLIFEGIRSLEILREVDDPGSFIRVYEATVKFYLGKAFDAVTQYFEARAKIASVEFKPENRRLGRFYQPKPVTSSQERGQERVAVGTGVPQRATPVSAG